jgi:hypothetical protein
MPDRVIFTFWEPRLDMPAYLQLCLRTWKKNLPGYDIVCVDYGNMHNYMPVGALDLSLLKKFSLPVQKDAIMVALLQAGGIFMDVDTVALGDIAPLAAHLGHAETVQFNRHCAFLAARPGARILTLWLEGIQYRLERLKQGMVDDDWQQWDYLGNAVLNLVLEHIASNRRGPLGPPSSVRQDGLWDRVRRIGHRTRLDILLVTLYRKYVRVLERDRYGYMPERRQFTQTGSLAEQYVAYWFSPSLDLASVFHPHQVIIGLHNSWTPDWYKKLPEAEVLASDCLLSRTLKHVLQ